MKVNNVQLNILMAMVGIATVTIGIFTYLDNKQHKKMQMELMDLDYDIKLLTLAKAKNGVV